jgi:hypothetical protein
VSNKSIKKPNFMKKNVLFLLLSISLIMLNDHVIAGCFPSYMQETSPAAGSYLYSNKISFTFIGNGGEQKVVGGNIRIYKSYNNILIETISITSIYPVGSMGINNSGKFEFTLSTQLVCGEQYYVLIDPGSFSCPGYTFDQIRDSHGYIFAWDFTTAATPVEFDSGDPAYYCGGGTSSLSVNEGIAYHWSTGDTTRSVTVNNPGDYYVTVTYVTGCQAQDATSIPSLMPDYVPICLVTVDTLSQYNLIIWDKPTPSPIDSFFVYREISTDHYQALGAVPYLGAVSIFKDTVRTKYFPNTGDPNAGTYRYKLQVKDTCGNISGLSPYHNTIFIANHDGTFSWTQLYSIEGAANPVNSYVLMRDDSSTGNWHAVSSVAGSQYSVSDPAYQTFKTTAKWRVETQWDIICIPSKIYSGSSVSTSRSNSKTNNFAGIISNAAPDIFTIYPNPTTGIFSLEFEENNSQHFIIRILNVLGKVIYEKETTINHQTIDISNQPVGMYLVQIQKGEVVYNKKIVIQK